VRPLIVDALASGRGKRLATRDVIGAGPRAVAGVLEERRLTPRIIQAEALLRGDLDLGGYDLLLASGMTSDFRAVKRVVERWRAESDGPVLVGGPVASEPERVLFKTRADLCVIGEGELTLKELLNLGVEQGRLPDPDSLEGIRGIAHKDLGAVKFNRLRPVMKREIFNRLTPSTRIIGDYPLHRSARVYVEVLRGCSNYHRTRIALPEEGCIECRKCQDGSLEERYYCPEGVAPGCGYCSVPSLYGPPKSRSVERIVEEVRGLLSMGVRRVVLSGPGFLDYGRDLLVEPKPLTDPRHPEPNYRALEELLSSLKGIDLVAEGEASVMIENVKACLVTEKAAKVLGGYLKGTPVNIGFETGSREHASKLGRASTPEETIRALKRLKRAGLKPYVYFIHGLPGQTAETVEKTLKTIGKSVEAGASRIILYRFQPLPMSAFHDQPKAPPAMRDKLSKRIYDSARRANRALKEDLKGEKLRVVVAGPYDRDRRYHVAYPVPHGPVVLVDGGEGLVGELVEVEVVGVVSERMVRGRILDGMF
jgi:radical SAM superfamily enzyme YgiQ (UPF0313 family)